MSLAPAESRLCVLFGAAVMGNWARLRQLRVELPGEEVNRSLREALLQVHLFAGVPRAVESWAVILEAGGAGTPEPAELAGAAPGAGLELFGRIYGSDTQAVMAMLTRQHPSHAQWVLEHAYGQVLAREGLSARMREVLACVALALTGQERQFTSHARGALRCGATREELLEALEAVHGLDEGGCVAGAEEKVTRISA